MKEKRYAKEQIVYALRQVEAGEKIVEMRGKMGVSEPTFFIWLRKQGGMGGSEFRELWQLRQENAKLKAVEADLSLDKHVLQEVIAKEP